jgi:tetratricopeptide (TPR) repeat protein
MSSRCKTQEENATALEEENPNSAFELYKRAAKCYGKVDDGKSGAKCLEKAVKILHKTANSSDNIFQTLEKYTSVSEIYHQIGKSSESDKLMKNIYKKFFDLVKSIRSEVKDMKDPYSSEKRLTLAAAYAKAANNDSLRKACWVDLGDKFKEKASKISNPRQALDLYIQAAKKYNKGDNKKLVNEMYKEAAINFTQRGNQIEKSKKDLILAVENYRQAAILNHIAENLKAEKIMIKKLEELCEIIGLPQEHVFAYLENELGFSEVQTNIDDLP